MKKPLLFFLTLICSFTAFSQTYDDYWKEVRAAEKKDLPRSALNAVNKIRRKALVEKDEVQLLKALLTGRVFGARLSPDSAAVYVEAVRNGLKAEKDTVARLLWHNALAELLCHNGTESSRDSARVHYLASLGNPSLLARTSTRPYLPLLKKGKANMGHTDNLLYVAFNAFAWSPCIENGEAERLLADYSTVYERLGNRAAAMQCLLDRLKLQKRNRRVTGELMNDTLFTALVRLARTYGDLPETVAVYEEMTGFSGYEQNDFALQAANDSLLLSLAKEGIERYGGSKSGKATHLLQNFVNGLQAPEARFGTLSEIYLPGEKARFRLTARNAKRIAICLTPIEKSASAYFRLDNHDPARAAKRFKAQARTETFRLPARPAYAWEVDSVTLTMPEQPGVYAVQLLMDGKVKDTEVIKVSGIRALVFSSTPGHNRITILDNRTGRPVSGAKVTAYDGQGRRQVKTYRCDSTGTIRLALPEKECYRQVFFAETANDSGSEGFTLSSIRHYQNDRSKTNSYVDLFTDRAIYRPGQDVAFSLTAYRRGGDLFEVIPELEGRVTLYNVNRRAVDSLLVRTDSLGTAEGRFSLPKESLPGPFLLELKAGGLSASRFIRVEAYKRPTFTAETLPVTAAYSPGDTVRIEGRAETYSGVAVAGAKVNYEISRTAWYRAPSANRKEYGTAVTDEEGRFVIPAPLFISSVERTDRFGRFTYIVRYTVTAENGETVEGSALLPAAVSPARLETNLSEVLCKERLHPWTVRQTNAAGRDMDARVTYRLTGLDGDTLKGCVKTGERFLPDGLSSLPSGRYSLFLESETPDVPPYSVSFVLMSETDTRPADKREPLYFYSRVSEAGDSAFVHVGSPEEEATLFYDLLSDDRILESQRITLSDTLLTLRPVYRPEYGDGATAFFALVRNGRLYSEEISIKRPEPQKALTLRWTSFRNLVHPGSGENWTLSITDSKGQPVRANLLALLYDRSLDAFAPHSLNFSNICFSRVLPYARYRWRDSGTAWYGRTLFGYIGYNALSTEDRTATRWDDTLFENPWNTTFYGYSSGRAAGNRLMAKTAVSTIAHTGAQKEMAMDKVATVPEVAEDEMVQESVTAERGAATEQSLRSNFQETAFFLPRLRTDKDGTASLSFTLPESMTSWRFLALAHDRTMNFGSLDTLVTARKDLMIEAAAPRFVRPGDECEIPVRVTNLTDRTLTTEISLILSETLGEQAVLFDERQTQTLAAGESRTLFYLYKVATDTPALTLRAFGTTSAFSDGEERLIPVLPAEEEIVRTLPFSLDKPSTTTLRIDTLFAREGRNRSLTVELASRPAWIAVTALPALSGKERATSATELAESYYAFALGEATARLRPEIKYLAEQPSDEALRLTSLKTESLTDLTPWLRSARKEAERGEELRRLFDSEIAAARRHTALDRLAALQGSDGSWSWYPGMAGNSYITLEVATLLARVQKLAAEKEVDRLFLPALDFLKKHFQKDVSEMKRTEKRTKVKMRPSETQLRYLYLRTLLGLRPDEDARFIMDRMKASRHDFDLYHKALSAIILAEGGEEAEARLTIKSLMEYSVSREGAGRWFDSPRAEMSRNAYRIPTQCAAIEALEYFGRKAEAREMRLWLMQSKRTQMWETSRETADAVYALLTARDDRGNELSLAAERPVYYTLYKGRKIVALNAESETTTPSTAAYFKQTYRESPATEAETVKIRKTTDGLSWGAIYAAYTIPAEKVKTEGKGLALTVEMEIYDNGKWYPINTETVLRKGDRIRRALTLTADRDYDFVAVEAPHAACFQPAAPFSGYRYEDGLSVYRSLTDSRTDFFIEQVAKGSHRLTEEFFLDRSGIYRSAAMKAECLYAPEYRATAAEEILTITDCR